MKNDNLREGRRRGWRIPSGLLSLLLVVVLTGCASTGTTLDYEAALRQDLRTRGLDPNRIVIPFELNDEMRNWVRDLERASYIDSERLRLLRDRLLDPDEMKLEYAWGFTGTAEEVFEQRKANCLAFTNLFVGMARELEVPVYFLAVDRVETYRKHGDLVVVSDHVAVGYGDIRTELVVYDFSPYSNEGYRDVRPISDTTAVAMFHSNRGAELLQEGLKDAAIAWMRMAVAIDPELTPAWVNLGVALRRAGDMPGAEDAYKQALEIDPRNYSAYQNLAALLHFQGRNSEAEEFLAQMQKTPTKNPYTYLSLGDISLRSGRFEEAKRFYRRAVNLADGDAEVYAALGQVAAATGDMRMARRMLKKAQKIDGQNPRAVRLATTLDRGRI